MIWIKETFTGAVTGTIIFANDIATNIRSVFAFNDQKWKRLELTEKKCVEDETIFVQLSDPGGLWITDWTVQWASGKCGNIWDDTDEGDML